jgi:hypothetical protein
MDHASSSVLVVQLHSGCPLSVARTGPVHICLSYPIFVCMNGKVNMFSLDTPDICGEGSGGANSTESSQNVKNKSFLIYTQNNLLSLYSLKHRVP